MTFKRPRARILEISTTSGSGPLALNGAADGSYNTFASFMAVGDQTFVTVVEPGVAFWSGIATYSAANQITLTTVEETKGTFGAGTKEVMASPLASASMLREDISGSIVTAGTATAYTVASFRKYNSLAELDGNIIAFTPHATNTQGSPNVTLNVDGLGAKSLRADPTRELPPGVLIAGTPYTARYNHSTGIFYLHGVFGLPYSIPLGAGLDYWGLTAPSSAFAFPIGQEISRTVYSDLFALLGTQYGAGDGSTTFNLPDRRGRVSAQVDVSGVILTNATMSPDGSTRGAIGGAQTIALATNQLPSHAHAVYLKDPGHRHRIPATPFITAGASNLAIQQPSGDQFTETVTTGITIGSVSGVANDNSTANTGGGAAHNNMQPTILCNYILRVL